MANLTTTRLAQAGVTPTFVAAAGGGDTTEAGSLVFIVVKNGGGAPITVTVAVPGSTEYGVARPQNAISVTNGSEKWIGPLKPEIYAQAVTGRVNLTYSAVTSVTLAVVAF